MKKTKHVLFIFAFILSAIISKAQAPNTCSAAISKSYPLTTFTVSSYSDSTYWFTMSLSAGDYNINITNQSTSGKISTISAYIGSCGSQTLVNTNRFDARDTANLNLRFTLSSSLTVYFKLTNFGSGSNFVVSALPFDYFSGNAGFCPGETVTLTAQCFNSVGVPTYTWLPGASNATVITITPTTATTYTLICNSGAGIVTFTQQVFPMPTNFCNGCEYVQNGSFENYLPLPGYGDIHVAKYWHAPSSWGPLVPTGAGTAELCHGAYKWWGSSASVPVNYYNTNLPANTGYGYMVCRIRGGGVPTDQRTYAEQQLKYPLVTGQTYSVGFYLATSDGWGAQRSANFGAYLSTSTIVIPSANEGYVFPGSSYTPQVVCTTTALTCHTWTPISGTLTGAGEQYLTLGNFRNDAATPSYSSTCAGSPGYPNNYLTLQFVDDISITPLPPVLSVSDPTITNCSQTTLTLTASGSPNAYTSWTDGTNTYTGNVVVVPVPVFATTYTCSVNLPYVGSCGLGGTVSVYNACTTCSTPTNVLGTSLTSTTLSNTFYAMNNNLTINGNCTFDKCEIQIIATASITVVPGATLNILGSHLYACGNMWQGIVVQPGGVLNLNTSGPKSAFIEDAIQAVFVQSTTLTTNVLTSIYTTYNKNKTSIYIGGYTPTISPYPFTIYGNTFTSRTIAFTAGSIIWPHCNTIKAATNPTTSPLESPYINETTYPPTTLKAPYNTFKPDYGIYLDGVGATLNASTTPTYYEIQIGIGSGLSNTYNIFDNLYYGIYANDANLFCINNIFQKGQIAGKARSYGYGIHAQAVSNRRLKVTGATSTTYINKFFELRRCINTGSMFEHIITDCDMRSTATQYTAPPAPINPVGYMGVNMTTQQYRNINVTGNHLYNITNGILFTADVGYFSVGDIPTQGRYGGQVDLSNNEIRAALPTQTITTQFVNVAISANDVMTSTSGYSVFTIPSTSICANTNTITNVWNGISQTNFGQQPATVWNNTVTMNTQPTTLSSPLVQYGIQNNQLSNGFIYKNTVTGPTSYTTGIKAITTSMNSTLTVKCNVTSQADRGIEFNSTQANTVFWDNIMSSHTYGVALDNAGIIGTQGSTTVPTDNQWTGTWTGSNYKTATKGTSTATNSIMYIRYATGNYDPNGSGWTDLTPGQDNYFYPGTGTTLLNITGSPSARTCPTTPLCRTCRGFAGEQESIASNEALLEQLANGKILYKNPSLQQEYINEHNVYRQLTSQSKTKSSAASNTPLHQFYNASARTSLGSMDDIEVDLLSGDYASAQAKIASLTPTNSVESNYKNYYTAYVNSKQGHFTSTDSTNLTNLASGCPYTDGGVVYQARALYNVVFDTYLLFYDICKTSQNNERLINNSEQKSLSVIHLSRVYPNPTNGIVNVEFINAKDKDEVSITIVDVTGKTVYNTKQILNGNIITMQPDLNSGTYLIKLKLSDGTTDVHRIVISK